MTNFPIKSWSQNTVNAKDLKKKDFDRHCILAYWELVQIRAKCMSKHHVIGQ